MSDEDDYMSDAFLLGCASADVRPGLIHNHSLKRQHNILKKKENSDHTNREKHKPIQELQRENLESGLDRPLDSENRGYALLQKMGFKPGSGLGKEGSGRSEPIKLEIKADREGLGVKAALQEMRARIEKKWIERQKNAPTIEDFRSRIINESNERYTKTDLKKSQKICHALDIKQGLSAPLEEWFWPEEQKQDKEEEDDDEEDVIMEIPMQDKLEMLTLYLRRTYFYCIWCGNEFDDEKDLQQECPGPTRSDH